LHGFVGKLLADESDHCHLFVGVGFGAFLIWDDYAHPPNDTVIYLWPRYF